MRRRLWIIIIGLGSAGVVLAVTNRFLPAGAASTVISLVYLLLATTIPILIFYMLLPGASALRRTALFFLVGSGALLNLLPAIIFALQPLEQVLPATFSGVLRSILTGIIEVFPDVYFSILPGLLIVGAALFFYERLAEKKGRKEFGLSDLGWATTAVLSLALFVAAYSSAEDSIFRTMKDPFAFVNTVAPGLGFLSPNLYTFTIWITLFTMITAAIFLYDAFGRLGYERQRVGALLLGGLMALIFAVISSRLPIFAQLEEFFIVGLFTGNRNPGTEIHEASGKRYCPAPYDDKGKKVDISATAPPGIRDDIVIIGISKETIETLKGNWPLDWQHYADLTNRLANAEDSIVLFDISFLDKKEVYGGNYCGRKFQCIAKPGQPPVRNQYDVLAQSIAAAKNTVLTDYPMETTDEARNSIDEYEKRMRVLEKTARMDPSTIRNGKVVRPWARLPLPPIEPVLKAVHGAGFANVVKNQWGINRRMPLVNRIVNQERSGKPGYDPDKDDSFYPGIDLIVVGNYYGVDPHKDVEVDFLRGYLKIKNIPKKTRKVVDWQKGGYVDQDIMAKPNEKREVSIPIDSNGFMNINFRGGFYCFKFHELLDITSQEGAAGNFKGKIALVAMYYATGVATAKDMHLSPYGDMAGIEHHAYALNTILNQDFLVNAPPIVNLLVLLVIGLIMGLYQPRVPTWMSFVLLIVIAGVFVAITSFVTFQQYSYLHIFPTVIILQFVVAISFIGFRALTEEENVKFIRNTFSKFVSQDVVEELLSNPEAIALGGAKKEVSVFFSDVRGFTTISEKLGPEELVQLLNEYLSVMTELIIDYRGTIDKYMGDAIMAFWGAPAKNDEHAYYACVAAIAQIEALHKLQVQWSQRQIPVLDIGIGINTGQAVVGNMGSSHRMDYTLMGDTVNLGSRLEGITKTYGVRACISEFTYERVKDRVYARELDLVRVKGKLEPVRIYELMGIRKDTDLNTLKRSAGG